MITLPCSDLEKQKILIKIAAKFEFNKKYSQAEVNEIIHSFDVDDHVLFRRELVNFNYLGTDAASGEYWLKKKELLKGDLDKIRKNQERMGKAGVY